jgi:hypothetical protein
LWDDEDFQMMAVEVEVKARNAEFTLEIVGIYSAPNEDMRAVERLAT